MTIEIKTMMEERIPYRPQHDYDKRFPLWHCILYYLNWYETSMDKWQDLKNCLIMDGYPGEHMTNADVYRLVLNVADDFNLYCANKGWKMISVAVTIPDGYEWWVEEYRKKGIENPEWMYGIDKLFSQFALDYDRTKVKLPKPDFKKGDPIRYSGYKFGKTYKEANKHAGDGYKWEGVAPDWDWRKYYDPRNKK